MSTKKTTKKTKKKTTKKKTSTRARIKDPKGGLTAAGRAYFRKKEGAHLKPGVKGVADTPEKMKRKGSFSRALRPRQRKSQINRVSGFRFDFCNQRVGDLAHLPALSPVAIQGFAVIPFALSVKPDKGASGTNGLANDLTFIIGTIQ